MTTITIKKDGKNKILIFNSLEKLKSTIVGCTRGKLETKYVSIKEKDGKKEKINDYYLVAFSFDQNDDAVPYLKRLGIIEKDSVIGEL